MKRSKVWIGGVLLLCVGCGGQYDTHIGKTHFVGPGGDVLEHAGAVLSIPRGAFEEVVQVSLGPAERVSTPPAEASLVGRVYEIAFALAREPSPNAPEQTLPTRFALPATLALPIPASLAEEQFPQLVVLADTKQAGTFQTERNVMVDSTARRVTVQISAPGIFALGLLQQAASGGGGGR